MSGQCVVLIHGIWMNGMELALLQWRLRRAGYRVRRFRYASVFGQWEAHQEALSQFVAGLDAQRIHLVAHSLGGLLLRDWLEQGGDPRLGHLVTLGTPHQGSSLARRMCGSRPGRWLLGGAGERLCAMSVPWRGEFPLGIIAGDYPLGVGSIIPGLVQPSDGTVALTENWLERATDRRVLHLSHFGLVFSAQAAQLTVRFLRDGRFG